MYKFLFRSSSTALLTIHKSHHKHLLTTKNENWSAVILTARPTRRRRSELFGSTRHVARMSFLEYTLSR